MIHINDELWQITSPYFCAGLVANETGEILDAAPIIGYMKTWRLQHVKQYCDRKKWKLYYIQ